MLKKLNRTNISNKQRPVTVLQFGEGNFLRAFVDWTIDILNEKTSFNGDVQIVQPIRQGMGEMLNAQEGLYHVLLQGLSNGSEINDTRLVSCVRSVINPFVNWNEYLETAENPDLKFIVSNTTEAGINFLETDKSSQQIPESFPGKLTLLLYHRFKCFRGDKQKGLILLPCELIEKNGENLKTCILQYITLWKLEDAFKNWIVTDNIFCNTLVDRIVPGFPRDTAAEIQEKLGYEDQLLVKAEPFHLWVIEGNDFVSQQFPAQKAGLNVVFTDDLTPYRSRKVRILNGAHTVMVPVAYLQGLRTVREAVEDRVVGQFIRKTIFDEIIPTLELPENELKQFASDVIERFSNPSIRHELMSIALNSISKYAVRVLPSFVAYYDKTGELPPRLTWSLAALIAFYRGKVGDQEINLQDSKDVLNYFKTAWSYPTVSETITAALQNSYFKPFNLINIRGLVKALETDVNKILQQQRLPVES